MMKRAKAAKRFVLIGGKMKRLMKRKKKRASNDLIGAKTKKRAKDFESSALIGGNDDLITDILIRLPAKSIARFRCVCKRFLSLTSDPKFITEHASHAPIVGFYCSYFSKHVFLDPRPYSLRYPRDPLDVESSSNGGLLLLRKERRKRDRFFLFNPTTRKTWPAISPSHNIHHLDFATLLFDPSLSLDFQIVGFVEESCSILIFCSRTQSWKTISRLDSLSDILPSNVFCCKRRVWWDYGHNSFLSWFDIDSETFGRVELPPGKETGCRLGTSRGNIHAVVNIYTFCLDTSFCVWQLMHDFSGWSKLYTIHPLDLIRGPPLGMRPRIVHFHKGNEGEGDRLFFELGNMFSYHLQTRIVVDVSRTELDGCPGRSWAIFPHVETLLSPDQISTTMGADGGSTA